MNRRRFFFKAATDHPDGSPAGARRGLTAWMLLLVGGMLPLVGTGCQTSVGGQTLPSAYYLDDDVQYFPHGPEFLLPNQVRAIEEYQLDQQAAGGGLGDQAP